jgi:prepilin signal peptidase PulO-like enzyme (type II secretory pathway)
VPARRSILRPPSSCGSCSTEILWRDNIPLLSYALLGGRCRHCHASISFVYPLVEAVTALLIVACVAVLGPTSEALLAGGFSAVLVVLSVIDARHRIVPNRIVLPAAAIALVAHSAIDHSPEWLVWSLIAAGALFLAALVHPRGLGMGDVKLALLLGAVLGAWVTIALLIALFAALVPAAILVSRHGASARKLGFPFVPFLSLGAVVALFFGEAILRAYLRLF